MEACAGLNVRARSLSVTPASRTELAISSGDKDPRDPDLQTFHPLVPKGLYYGYIDGSGSLNAIVLHPSAALQLSRALSLRNEVFWFWRQRRTLRRNSGSTGAGLASGPACNATFQAARYWVGEYFRETPPARDLTYFSAKVSYKF